MFTACGIYIKLLCFFWHSTLRTQSQVQHPIGSSGTCLKVTILSIKHWLLSLIGDPYSHLNLNLIGSSSNRWSTDITQVFKLLCPSEYGPRSRCVRSGASVRYLQGCIFPSRRRWPVELCGIAGLWCHFQAGQRRVVSQQVCHRLCNHHSNWLENFSNMCFARSFPLFSNNISWVVYYYYYSYCSYVIIIGNTLHNGNNN